MAYTDPAYQGPLKWVISASNQDGATVEVTVSGAAGPNLSDEGLDQAVQGLVDLAQGSGVFTVNWARKEMLYVSELTPTAPTEE